MRQGAFWCRHCANTRLCALGLCRSCYDRRRHSRLRFGGYREQVLLRDRCCRLCQADRRLAVHHRRPGLNRPAWQITVCLGCHVRLHRRLRLPPQPSHLFLLLWQEQHPGWPVQLTLPLAA